MNPIEKYDGIINKIENNIEEEPYDTIKDLIDNLLNIGITTRDLGAVIKFFTGMSLVEYIRKRKMNYSYKRMKEMPKFDLNKVIGYTEYSDQSSYSKAFKKEYGLPPKKAYESDEILSREPMTMDIIKSSEDFVVEDQITEQEQIFGVDKDIYNRIIMAQDYKEIYGFNDIQANVAYKYSENNNVPLDDAFEFVSGGMIECEEFIGDVVYSYSEEELESILYKCDKVLNMFYNTELSDGDIRMISRRCKIFDVDFFELDEEFVWNYMNTRSPLDEFIKTYKFYLANKDDFLDSDEVEDFFRDVEMFGDYEVTLSYIKGYRDSTIMDESYEEDDDIDLYFDCKEDYDNDKDFYGEKLTIDYEHYDPYDPFGERYDKDNPEYYYDDVYDQNDSEDIEDDFDNQDYYDDD